MADIQATPKEEINLVYDEPDEVVAGLDYSNEPTTFEVDGTTYTTQESNGKSIVSKQQPLGASKTYGYSPEERAFLEKSGPITMMEQWMRRDWRANYPYLRHGAIAADFAVLSGAQKRLQENDYSYEEDGQILVDTTQQQKDDKMINDYMRYVEEEQIRGVSMGGQIFSGIADLPATMIEFAISTPIYTATEQTAATATKAIMKKQFKKSLVGKITQKVVPPVVGAIGQGTFMIDNYRAKYKENKFWANMAVTDYGAVILDEAKESSGMSFVRAWGDVVIEAGTERSGVLFGKVGGAATNSIAKRLSPKTRAAFKRVWDLIPARAKTKAILKKGGFNGIAQEIGEERLGDILRGAFNINDLEGNLFERIHEEWPDLEGFYVELGVFAAPGSVSVAGGIAERRWKKRGATATQIEAMNESLSENEKRSFVEEDNDKQIDTFLAIKEGAEMTEEQEGVVNEMFDEMLENGQVEETDATIDTQGEYQAVKEVLLRGEAQRTAEEQDALEAKRQRDYESAKKKIAANEELTVEEELAVEDYYDEYVNDTLVEQGIDTTVSRVAAIEQAEQTNQGTPIQKTKEKKKKVTGLKGTLKKIKKVLKSTKPKKVGKRHKGKYDSETNRVFGEMNRINNLTPEEAQKELSVALIGQQASGAEATVTDKMIFSALALQAQGDKVSQELADKVLADVERLKKAGSELKADDKLTGKKELNERISELQDKAYSVGGEKANEKSVLTYLGNAVRRGIDDLGSTILSMFGFKASEQYDMAIEESDMKNAIGKVKRSIDEKIKELYNTTNHVKKMVQLKRDKGYKLVGSAGTIVLNRLQLIGVFNSLKNKNTADMYDKEFGKGAAQALVADNLTPEDIAFGNYLQEVVQAYLPIFNQKNIEETGLPLDTISGYWPRVSEIDQKDPVSLMQILGGYHAQSNTPSPMKERSNLVIPRPDMQDAYEVAVRHISQGEYIDKMARKYELVKSVFGSKEMGRYIKNRYGDGVYKKLISDIEDQSLNGRANQIDFGLRAWNYVYNNWIVSKIAFKVTSAAVQATSATLYSMHMNPAKWSVDFAKALASPRETIDYMLKQNPWLLDRYNMGYNDFVERALQDSDFLGGLAQKTGRVVTTPTRGMDIGAQVFGGYPLVKALTEEVGEKKANEMFRKISTRTQQSGLTANLAPGQKNPYTRWLFAFANTFGQFTRLQTDAVYRWKMGEISTGKMVQVQLHVGVMQAALASLLRQGAKGAVGLLGDFIFDDDEDEDMDEIMQRIATTIATDMATHPFQFIPGVKGPAKYIVRRKSGQKAYSVFSTPVIDEVEMLLKISMKKKMTTKDWVTIAAMAQEGLVPIGSSTLIQYYNWMDDE